VCIYSSRPAYPTDRIDTRSDATGAIRSNDPNASSPTSRYMSLAKPVD
jgi:hypothetical protein